MPQTLLLFWKSWGSRKGNDWPTAPQLVTAVARFRSRHVALQPFRNPLRAEGFSQVLITITRLWNFPVRKKKAPWPESEKAPRTCQAFSSEAPTPAQCNSLVCKRAPPTSTTQRGQRQIGHLTILKKSYRALARTLNVRPPFLTQFKCTIQCFRL